jgi:uncharacterized Zn-finger protein
MAKTSDTKLTTYTRHWRQFVPISIEFPVMRCGNCEASYVLITITAEGQDTDLQSNNVWQDTADVVYCPYCGARSR